MQIAGTPFPIGEGWEDLKAAFADAMATAKQYAAPVPTNAPPIDPLLIAGGAACMLVVDIVVGTMRRVPLAGLPLLTIYSIPVSLLGDGVSWVIFTLTTVGFLLMLYLQESRQIARWGRPLGQDPANADPSGFGVSNGALRSSASTIGGVATALAIVVPVFIPTFSVSFFGNGFGPGGGDQIKIENPMADLKRDLDRGLDVPMIQVRTDDPNPAYLRISVLNRFTDNTWSSGDRKVPSEQRAIGEMPPIEGLGEGVPTTSYDYEVEVTNDFISTWLPTQAPISRIDAPGDWRYDLSTMDFIRGDDELTTAGLSYTMTAVQPDLSAQQMAAARAPTELTGTQLTELPPNLPGIVREIATEQTRDLPNNFQKAVAIQDYFRANGSYDLTVSAGNGSDTLEHFLSDGPDGLVGYCEQFASAMAVMARTLGIPARVAIGFLRPAPLGGDTWVYSAHDLHAWPELYFPGSGWVRFEPTPADRATTVPDYTTVNLPVPEVTDTATAAASPGDLENRPELSEGPDPGGADAAGNADSGFSVPWRSLLIGLGVVLVVVALACLPRLLRRRRRARRLVLGPEDVWTELRDTVIDLGLTWPAGRSPRETGSHLVHYFGKPVGTDTARLPRHGVDVAPEAETALENIVSTIELRRYARHGAEPAELREDAEAVIAALTGGVTAGARRRAEWLPRSLVRGDREPVRIQAANEEQLVFSGGVDHAG